MNMAATNTEFLEKRIQFNKKSARDYDEWLINECPPLHINAKILDLGCGTGKQLSLFSKIFPHTVEFYGIDISKHSLDKAKKNIKHHAFVLKQYSFEDYDKFLDREDFFDLIYSCYALYYCKPDHLYGLLQRIFSSLKKEGVFWVVGPYKNTNKELFEIIKKYYEIPSQVLYSLSKFYDDLLVYVSKVGFQKFSCSLFRNHVFFENIEDVLTYYKHTTYYNGQFLFHIKRDLKNIMKNNSIFSLTKEVISYKFYKQF